jgi:hypothetical protein
MNNNATARPAVADTVWLRSFQCGPDGQNCVELGFTPHRQIRIRDSKSRRFVTFGRRAWQTFLGVQTG